MLMRMEMVHSLTLLYVIVAIIFVYIGILVNAPIPYHVFVGAYVLVGWVCLVSFDKFINALLAFQNSFNQWVREIFKLNGKNNGNDGEKPEK